MAEITKKINLFEMFGMTAKAYRDKKPSQDWQDGYWAGEKHRKQHIDEGIENRKLLFSEKSNMWYRKGTGALFTNSDEIAGIENKVLQDIKRLNK